VSAALRVGFGTPARPLKVNAVVLRGVNDGEVPRLATEITREKPIDLRFIEYMPFAGVDWSSGSRTVPAAEMQAILRRALPGFQEDSAGSGTEGTLFRGGPGWAGRIGFITTVSNAFCATCSRLRLNADGSLRACLHSEDETSLRDVLRAGGSTAQIDDAIASAVSAKARALGGKTLEQRAQALAESGGRGMVKIGG